MDRDINIHIGKDTYTLIYTCIHINTYTNRNIHMCTHIDKHVQIEIHTCTEMCTHACSQPLPSQTKQDSAVVLLCRDVPRRQQLPWQYRLGRASWCLGRAASVVFNDRARTGWGQTFKSALYPNPSAADGVLRVSRQENPAAS